MELKEREERLVEKMPEAQFLQTALPELEFPPSKEGLEKNLNELVGLLSSLGLDVSSEKAAMALLASPNTFEDFLSADALIKASHANLGIKEKLYALAAKSLMEFCQEHGCPQEKDVLLKRWEDARKMAMPERLKSPLPLAPSRKKQTELLTNEAFISKELMATRLFLNAKDAAHELSQGNEERFFAALSELPEENNARTVAASIALNETLDKNPEAVERVLPKLDSFALELPEGVALNYGSFSIQPKDARAYLESVLHRGKRVSVEVRRKESRPILIESYGNEKSLLIVVAPHAKVVLTKEGFKDILGEGKYNFKGPLMIEVVDGGTSITYELKEPLILNVTVKVKALEEF